MAIKMMENGHGEACELNIIIRDMSSNKVVKTDDSRILTLIHYLDLFTHSLNFFC
jgi:hypothetical protein